MASGRILKTQISLSEQVNDLSIYAALLFTWMIPHADDFGRMHGGARKVKALVVPMRDDFTSTKVEECLCEMHRSRLVQRYEIAGEIFLAFPSWDEHQHGLHKRTTSKFPAPTNDDFPEIPGNSRKFLPELELELELEQEQEQDKKTLARSDKKKSLQADGEKKPPAISPAEDETESEDQTNPETISASKDVDSTAIRLPLNDKTERAITDREMAEMVGLYPAVDVLAELRKMRGWLLGNPAKRKTKNGVMRFVHAWLGKQQNLGGTGARASPVERSRYQGLREKRYGTTKEGFLGEE